MSKTCLIRIDFQAHEKCIEHAPLSLLGRAFDCNLLLQQPFGIEGASATIGADKLLVLTPDLTLIKDKAP